MAVALLLATGATIFVTYQLTWLPGPDTLALGARLSRAAAFTVTLLAILVVHEAGHILQARRHGVRIGLPWFLPFPLLVGTLGAIIRIRDTPRSRRALVAMGAGGPLAGLVAIAVVAGIAVRRGALPEVEGELQLNAPLLWHAVAWLQGVPSPIMRPSDPLAFAAWIGCLVTAMNLLPLGQLDGGHVAGGTLPRLATVLSGASVGALAALGISWWPWWAWLAALIALRAHRGLDTPEGPPPSPLWIGLCTLTFVLCFVPQPTGS